MSHVSKFTGQWLTKTGDRNNPKSRISSAVSSYETNKKRKEQEKLNLQKQVAGPKDISEYCRLVSDEFKNIDDWIRETNKTKNQHGLSAAVTKRAKLKADLIRGKSHREILDILASQNT